MNAGAQLYLDTARLGRMRRSAQRAVRDFARLSGEVALTLYGKNFYRHGFEVLGDRLQLHCPGLKSWKGVDELRRRLLAFVDAGDEHTCALASRSLTFVRLAAAYMSHRCKRVILPDLLWRPYADEIRRAVTQCGGEVVHLNLRREVFSEHLCAGEIAERLIHAFVAAGCDGACLPAVTHDGIRLPVDQIVPRLKAGAANPFIVVDAAQAIGHLRQGLGISSADLVVAGVHKWLRGGMPLGVGFGPQGVMRQLLAHDHDDSLLRLLTPDGAKTVNESVNLWPLISCNAVVAEDAKRSGVLATRMANRRAILKLIRGRGWKPVSTHPTLRSGILLLSHAGTRRQRRQSNSEAWQLHFQRRGIAVSSYPGGMIRLSLPGRRLRPDELGAFAAAL